MTVRFPEPLAPGSRIAVTAPSSGVGARLHPRLDLVLEHLRARGYAVEEGRCLRDDQRHVSAPAEARAAELMALLLRDDVDAIVPPWGGELAVELLPRLDLARIARARPKWVLGYSDTSTLLLPLTLVAGFATAHGANLMDQAPSQTDPLLTGTLPALHTPRGGTFTQRSSERWQLRWTDFAAEPTCALNPTEPTRWRRLGPDPDADTVLSGRAIGGCLDTVSRLVGSPYGDVPGFVAAHRAEGVVLYLENCELTPPDVARALWSLRFAGWFDGIAGLVLGRSAGPDRTAAGYTYDDALASALGDLPFPVLVDADIGHRPPQLLLVNGALAQIRYAGGRATVTQQLC